MVALKITDAKKWYDSFCALKGINLEVASGEFFGLLGPNGAGKSTLIKAIVGLIKLSSGSLSVFGHDVVDDYMNSRRLVGYAPQEVNLDRYFSIRKILEFHSGYFGASFKEQKQKAEELLEQFRLTDKAHLQFYKLSGGMQKRVLVAKSLVANPKLLILDEPTAGVDVEQRHELWIFLRKLNQSGTTIILTTHYIEEAEALCSRVGLINHGAINEVGPPKALIDKYCEPYVVAQFGQTLEPLILDALKINGQIDGSRLILKGKPVAVMISDLMKGLSMQPDILLQDIQIQKGDLEEVFLKYVKQKTGVSHVA